MSKFVGIAWASGTPDFDWSQGGDQGQEPDPKQAHRWRWCASSRRRSGSLFYPMFRRMLPGEGGTREGGELPADGLQGIYCLCRCSRAILTSGASSGCTQLRRLDGVDGTVGEQASNTAEYIVWDADARGAAGVRPKEQTPLCYEATLREPGRDLLGLAVPDSPCEA